jgi:hypothetical protein
MFRRFQVNKFQARAEDYFIVVHGMAAPSSSQVLEHISSFSYVDSLEVDCGSSLKGASCNAE